jgi:hypothetical protein
MAETGWIIEEPIDFSAYGDRTFEAFQKGSINEVARVYEHLNWLVDNSVSFANVAISGSVASAAALPTTGVEIGDIYSVAGDAMALYAWSGTAWILLTLTNPEAATVGEPGTVMLGTLASALSDEPSTTKVVSEAVLAQYSEQGASGVMPGGIMIWRGNKTNIPAGWLFCDGTNGTPDLRGNFVRYSATDGGTDEEEIPASTLINHTHKFTVAPVIGTHRHRVVNTSAYTLIPHSHGARLTQDTTDVQGEHFHDTQTLRIIKQAVGWSFGWSVTRVLPAAWANEWPSPVQVSGEHVHRLTGIVLIDQAGASHTHTINTTTALGGTSSQTLQGVSGAATQDIVVVKDNKPRYQEVIYIMKAVV